MAGSRAAQPIETAWTARGLPRVLLAFVVLAATVLLAACGNGTSANDEPGGSSASAPAADTTTAAADAAGPGLDPAERTRVAVSFGVLADIVANVGGERTDVWSVIPSGADPHHYEVTPQNLVRLSEADYLVMVGGHFEAFAERTPWRRAAREADIPTMVVTDSIPVIVRDLVVDHGDHVHDYRGGDPHFWLDPQRVLALIPVIADGLSGIDPEGADYYHANAERYAAEVEALDAEMEEAVASIPPERRVLIVQHDAYGYLAERFGFEVLGSVLSTLGEGESSAANLVDLHELIEDRGVPAVFREPQIQSPVLDTLASDEGIKVGVLMTDAFTEEDHTYLDLMRFNIDSLVTNLR